MLDLSLILSRNLGLDAVAWEQYSSVKSISKCLTPSQFPNRRAAPPTPDSLSEVENQLTIEETNGQTNERHEQDLKNSRDKFQDFSSFAEFNFQQVVDFAPIESLGYTKDTITPIEGGHNAIFLSTTEFRYVRGFQAHAFQQQPHDLIPEGANFRWKLERLELISLLKFETPVAYVSKHLPAMEKLKNVATRSLTAFEEQAITKLHAGDQIVVETAYNEQRMVGSIRAAKKCLECHRVRHGGLLGAFTYRFYRDPQLPLPGAPKRTL